MDAMDVLNGCRPSQAPDMSKLKRMPHVFPRVLELPLHAETPVRVMESRDCYRFQVRLPGALVGEVKVEVLEIVPGATKVLVRGLHHGDDLVPEVNFWRFRLPPTTVPEKSLASYSEEYLYVTIPKVDISCNDFDMDANHSDTEEDEFETADERMQRRVLEHLDSFGSPRRTRSRSPRKSFEFEVDPEKLQKEVLEDLEKLQQEVLEDLESFGSPRRRSASCTQSLKFQGSGSQDFFRSVGSWVGGFSVPVQ